MKRFKPAFTMIELMVCFVVIGLIMTVAVKAIKSATGSYTTLTYFAMKNMKTIVRSMWEINSEAPLTENNGHTHDSSEDFIVSKCYYVPMSKVSSPTISEGEWSLGIIKPDYDGSTVPEASLQPGTNIPLCANSFHVTDESESGSFNFCKRVAAMANTAGGVNCNTLRNVGYRDSVPYITDLNPDSPNFTATNGQRYYFSRRAVNSDISPFGFRLIAIDLNGRRGPNLLSPSSEENDGNNANMLPDIVTFMLLDNGVIFPLGVAADNKYIDGKYVNYLNSRVKAYSYSTSPNIHDEPDNSVPLNTLCLTSSGANLQEDRAVQKNCQYVVKALANNGGVGNAQRGTVSSYKTMFCLSAQQEREFYPDYCDGINVISVCPGGSSAQYDECYADPIKPMFRFNL